MHNIDVILFYVSVHIRHEEYNPTLTSVADMPTRLFHAIMGLAPRALKAQVSSPPSRQTIVVLYHHSQLPPAMFSIAFFTTLSLVPFVLGQSDDTQVQIEGIEAHFEQSKLVPDLLQSFDPTAILAVDFEGQHDCLHIKDVYHSKYTLQALVLSRLDRASTRTKCTRFPNYPTANPT